MAQSRKERMEELAKALLAEYLASGEQPFEFSIPLVWKGTTISTGEEAVVVVFTTKEVHAEKAAGLTPRAEVRRCPTCNRPF